MGVSGINFHGSLANCGGYAPLCAPTPEDLATGALGAQPEWYALLLAKDLIGDRPLGSVASSPGRPNVRVTTLLAGRGRLHAVIVDQLRIGVVEPAVLESLAVEERAGIGGSEGDLDGMGVDLRGEADGLLDGFPRLARQPHDESAVDGDAQLVTVLGELARHVDAHALLDIVQDLLVAALVADQQEPQAVVA